MASGGSDNEDDGGDTRGIDPIRPTDDQARALARSLIASARFAALAVLAPDGGHPAVTRVAVALGAGGGPVTLVSDLAAHTRALRADPRAGLLLGEPAPKGDPLTHPRLSLQARAEFVAQDGPDHAALRALWLARHPKARLYIDFADFRFVRLVPLSAALNGGFGRAFHLTAEDLAP
ncbi:HugZ family pyridoxamine 5'-phosphate oxidase [Frigidibacter oleivorans]|uniref:HugZ family pyridoxamine 5'-phosphate oxidase n=1 Tax=Frigidibacter oleivorans TaxID=2487129 RepID=UPI000F8F170D|nr:pyridoxamine 5'-phosphate oxidase family protein [Frigidibacter oleivorans]